MLTYTYVARDSQTGQRIKADIQALDEASAANLLVEKGLAPLQITLKKERSFGSLSHRVGAKDKIIFSRQLSTLINAGLPLAQSLRTVGERTKNKTLTEIINRSVADIEGGASFADALVKYPLVFDDVYVSLIAAGEASGTLDKTLERLANQLEREGEVISKVRGAMIYPSIVLAVLVGVVIFMMTTILPQVENMYRNLPGASLPLVTQVLLAAAKFMINFWWLLLGLLAAAVFFSFRWVRTTVGHRTLDSIKLRVWPIKEMYSKLYLARFARAASTLMGAGVPLIKTLNISAKSIGNVHLEASLNRATEQVKGGKSLSESLRGDPNILPLVPDMIHIGEESGALEGMMDKLADYYEKEVDNQIKSITTVIEPAMMIMVGVLALFIVAAVLLPIYSLAGKNLLNLGGQ